MTRKKWIIAGVLLTVFLYGTFKVMDATGWDETVLFPFSQMTREVIAPVQKGITAAVEGTRGVLAYFSNNKALREKNDALLKETALLEEQVHKLRELELENLRLKNLLHYKEEKSSNYQLVMGKVIGRAPSSWYSTIIIDIGSSDGIKKDMPVVNHQGLVGIVASVTANTAEVQLILDAAGGVGARIYESRATPGVVLGTESGLLRLAFVRHDALIEVGQTVVTSGLSSLYPKGIRIGSVAEVNLEPNGLIKTALIKPYVDFPRLEEILVITEVKKAEEDTLAVLDPSVPNTVTAVPKGGGVR